MGNEPVRGSFYIFVATDSDHGVIGFEKNCGCGWEMCSVGEILEGDDGVEVDRGIVVFREGKGERNIFIKLKHFVGHGGWNV